MSEYTGGTVVVAEGARVAFFTCLLCGSTILHDPRDEKSMKRIHNEWHTRLDESK